MNYFGWTLLTVTAVASFGLGMGVGWWLRPLPLGRRLASTMTRCNAAVTARKALIGVSVLNLVTFALAGVAYLNVRGFQHCQARYDTAVASSTAARAEASATFQRAVRDQSFTVTYSIAHPNDEAAAQAARDAIAAVSTTFDALEQARKDHPVPDPPSKVCGGVT